MAPQSRKDEEFYAVYKGRVDKPTIYSSWGHAHPRVTECDGADHKKFDSHEEARNSMRSKGFTEIEEVLKHAAEEKATPLPRGAYYAVAYGKTTGIFHDWQDAKKAVERIKSACYQRFDTEREAKEFIKDWKDAYAEVWQRAIRQGLDEGWKPKDMELNVGKILAKVDGKVENNDETVHAMFERLNIKKEA